MNSDEYTKLAEVERVHWYYSGKRELVRRWLERTAKLPETGVLLDCGAGTGIFADSMRQIYKVQVLDDHAESLAILRTRFRPDEIIEGPATDIPLPDKSVNCVTALDVLEHIKDDRRTVEEIHRILQPGGCVVVTVPALMALWGYWDEALHHYRRYTAAELRALFPAPSWEVVHLNYTNVAVLPVVWIIRSWQRWRKLGAASRVEDKIPPLWLNFFLRVIFVRLGLVRMKFPFGVSLLMVARKTVSL